MRQAAETYQRGATDYKDAITTIVTLHYEEKKKAILGGLDREIGIEKDELKKARETAIKRLEDFVARYSGPNAQPEATPDAMYRLAALYEERARADDDPNADLAVDPQASDRPLQASHPRVSTYNELAGIYYFLGHALNDSRRVDEAQQVWRSLVCHNHYPYPVAAGSEGRRRRSDPADAAGSRRRVLDGLALQVPDAAVLEEGAEGRHDVTTTRTRTTARSSRSRPSCRRGSEVRRRDLVAHRRLGVRPARPARRRRRHEPSPSGTTTVRRARTRTRCCYKKPPLYGVALYKYAWTLFKQQRYDAAVREFVHLLNYTDEQEKLTGDPGADFRQEAYTYIAGSLDNYDFVGPGPDEPYIGRPDILDTARSPAEAEAKLRSRDRSRAGPALIPQDKPWTIEIYKALALEFRTINQYKNALAMYQLMLDKWPMDPAAPDDQNAIAEVYDLLARQTKAGPERSEYEQKVLEARTSLSKYIGDAPWVDANKDNPVALQRAEELVRTGLKGAAVTHTRNGQAALEQADQTGDPKEKLRLTTYALQEYKLAAIGWLGYLKQDENAPDAYKSRYFYADALHNEVRLEVALHQFDPKPYPEPTSQEIATAERAAVDVRDSDEDDQFIDNAGLFVVDLADVDRDLAFQRWQDSGGTQGVEPRKDPKLEGPEGDKKVVVDAFPDVIQTSMKARDEYIQRVPPERDKQNHAADYAFYAADQYYLYGHFDQAEPRFEAIYKERCGKDSLGYEAWKRLIVMSNLQKNAERSRELAEAEKKSSCAKTDLQMAEEKRGDLTDLVLQNAAFEDANKVFEQAKAAPPGPQKDALWRKAGGMYSAALDAAPAHKDAPAAAINSAFCYKQVGEFDKAIKLYQMFIDNYGSEDILNRLQNGGIDPEKQAKVGPDPAEYKERIKYLGMAYDALSTTYYGFFAYQHAAESFGKIASNPRFDDPERANAARIAMVLYSNLGDRANMSKMYGILVDPRMHLSTDKRAEADYLRASFDYAQWNPASGESAGNSAARIQAIANLEQFHAANKGRPESARYELESAYRIAKMMQSAGDPGVPHLVQDDDRGLGVLQVVPDGGRRRRRQGREASPSTDAPYSDYGGEADFTLVDEQVKSEFDYASGHHHYAGNVGRRHQVARQGPRRGREEVAADARARGDRVRVVRMGGGGHGADRHAVRLDPHGARPRGAELLHAAAGRAAQEAPERGRQAERRRAGRQGRSGPEVDRRHQGRGAQQVARDQGPVPRGLQPEDGRQVRDGCAHRAQVQREGHGGSERRRAPCVLHRLPRRRQDEAVRREHARTRSDPNSKLVYANGEFLQWRSGVVATPPANGQPAPLPAAP